MPSSKLLSLLALLPAAVLATDNASVQPSGLVRHSVTAQEGGSLFSRHSKRQLAAGSSTKRAGTLYTINVKFGTPGQSVPTQIDTTQSELFANPICAKSSNPEFCRSQQRFTMSSTLIDLGVQGHMSLRQDGGYVNFQYVSDYIGIESARITQQIFGVAYDSSVATNAILGLAPNTWGWTNGYPQLLDSLKTQGYINSRVFSLDVKGFASQSGSVIFGGIDTNKFIGDLVKLPVVPAAQSPDGLTRYWIRLDGLSVNKPDGSVVDAWAKPDGGAGQAFVIDSGASLTALPSSIYSQFTAAFPSATANGDGTLVVDCPTEGEGGSVNFIFDGKVINVPFSDFVARVPNTDTCLLGVYEDSFPVLGANFLRAAYVVFDQDNRNIHLAQSADCGAQSLVAVGTGADAVSSVTGACPAPVTSTTTTESSTTTEEATTSTEESTTVTEEATTTTEVATTITEEPTVTESAAESATETATDAEESECETEYESATETATESTAQTATESVTETVAESVTETSTAEPSITATETSAIETSAVETTSFPITTTAPPLLTITYTETSTSTITSCPPSVPKCPVGSVTLVTQVITATTTVCPQTSATYTFPAAGPSQSPVVVTLTPVEPLPAPVTVPGCSCTASPFPTGTGLAPGQPTTLVTVPHLPGTGVPHLPSAGVPHVPGTGVPHLPSAGVPHVPGTDVPHVPGTDAPHVPATQAPHVPGAHVSHIPGTGVPHLPGTAVPPVPTLPAHGGHNGTTPIPTVVPPPAQQTEPVTAGSAKTMMSWGAAAVVGGVLAAML